MSRAKILFAENDLDFLSTRVEILEKSGYQIVTATNTADARKALEESNVSLAIFDIRLVNDDDENDNSGLFLAKAPAYRKVPKIILTGFPSTEAAREALRQDAVGSSPAIDFLSKEEGPDAMLQAVANSLKATRPSWKLLVPPLLLLGALGFGILGILFSEPLWLIGTAIFGILYSFVLWNIIKG